jgi:phosphohistidine swiveling domain-containing protein
MGLRFTLPLADATLTLDIAGGKGTNLGILDRAGFPVPDAFVVTTHAYQHFVTANQLQEWAARLAAGAADGTSESLDEVSSAIRARFADGAIPAEIVEGIRAAYDALGTPAVAVRSSATTEDLPELSFAGQQDTYLHVVGPAAVLDAVARCWSSLWTARAIAYRNRYGVAHDDARLAVVVQRMVASDVSGVLFTANPLTGRRSEHVVEATMGLGEALVSGLVEPDRYVVDASRRQLTTTTLGRKGVSIQGRADGGTTTVATKAADRQALPDRAILELSEMGTAVARHFGTPQDIEWAWAADRLYLLQSRPITSLYPLPDVLDESPLQVLISLGAIQGMLDPFTPLGRDFFRLGAARVASLTGPPATLQSQRLMLVAGGRLFANVTGLLCNRHTRPVVRRALGLVEPGIARAVETVLDDPRLPPVAGGPSATVALRALPLLARIVGNATYHLLWPDAGRARAQRRISRTLAEFEAVCARASTLPERLSLFPSLFDAVARFGPVLMPALGVGLGSLHALHRLTADLPDAEQRVLEVTRGLPHNVTTEMDLALWRVAVAIRQDPVAAAAFADADSDVLASRWRTASMAPAAQAAIDDFLAEFGMRGVAEIDLGRPRWREDPRLLLQAVKSYLQITDPARAPDAMFRQGAESAAATIDALVADVRQRRHGWLRARLVRSTARRVRSLAGLRESPKFTAIRLLGLLRSTLLASGADLVSRGTLKSADDLFFLELEEVRALANGDSRDWRGVVDGRRADYAREQRRRQIPLLLLSDGVAHHASAGGAASAGDGGGISGTAVSPGVAEGIVRVIRDPHGARLEPGEILVCPGTDPAWTPLFLSAGGLVTEVGGLMTHGAVVAREYGIPAVVGVAQATTRLTTGMRIRVDGGRGSITILDE